MTPEPSNSPKSLFDLVVAADFAATPRALWLFHAACARRVADVLPDDNARSLIELTEQVADGVISIEQWGQAAYEVIDPYVGNERARDGAGGATFGLLMHLYPGEAGATRHVAGSVIEARAYRAATHGHPTAMTRDQWVAESVADEEAALLRLFHCLFDGPDRSVRFLPEWRTATVQALAEGIYAQQTFDRLPILADALQDAGCDAADVLAHCRGPGPHARGCWVIDRVLARQ